MSAVFSCDLAVPAIELPHCWQHTVGSDHARMALRADWQAQLRKAHDELGFRYVRFHGILDDDVGTLVREQDRLIYSFFNSDRIFDFLLGIGMKPFVELSFMPLALASGDATVFRYKGNVTPPRDYSQWETLINRLVSHWAERYGTKELRHWFFEVWNEPNLKSFWTGSQSHYFKLYKHAAEAIKAVDNRLKVGGPATANNAWVADFLGFCAASNIPADFISTHHYPTDAFGKPGDDTETQLSKSRRNVLREETEGVRALARGKPLYYTEWSSSSNPRDPMHDEPYAAAFAIRTSLEAARLVDAHSYWTFSDIFEENYFPSVPFHGGFGLLNLYGIAKPVYRAYQLLHELGNKQVPLDGAHARVDTWVIKDGNEDGNEDDYNLTVLCTNWGLPRHPIASERIRIFLNHAARPVAAGIRRIDGKNANAKNAWIRMGEPEYLSDRQVRRLHAASEFKSHSMRYSYINDTLGIAFTLAPQSVAAVSLKLKLRGKRSSDRRQHEFPSGSIPR
jgi:xylan 1,4-beta-xylosidase